jgi:hypothetical protein
MATRDNPIAFPDVKAAIGRMSRGERATSISLLPSRLIPFWLWGCDANEVCSSRKSDFHEMHLTAIVSVQVLTEAYTMDPGSVCPLIIDEEDISLLVERFGIFLPHFKEGGIPDNVSLQQLHDLIHAVQTQWPLLQQGMDSATLCSDGSDEHFYLKIVERLITQLLIWFGVFLFSNSIPPEQADDTEFVEMSLPTQNFVLTYTGIKFYLNIFFVLFRLLFIQRNAVLIPALQEGTHPFTVESFHVEASVDDFHMLGMYVDIPAGCLLEYKHSYSGFYNNVSQCVYRHFPSYQRRNPVSIEDVLMPNAADLSILPSLKQIYPEIGYAFEDHHFQKEISGVRKGMILANRNNAPVTTQLYTRPVNTGGCTKTIHSDAKPSEQMLARISACLGAGGGAINNGGVGGSVGLADWFWFIIGSNIYLVRTSNGSVYRGACRNLLTFYLTNKDQSVNRD